MPASATVKEIRIGCSRTPAPVPATLRTAEVTHCFGIAPAGEQPVVPDMSVSLAPGRIVAFVGPSGSGKSTALAMIERKCPAAHNVGRIQFPQACAVVDAVAPDQPLADALELLSHCALGEAPLWLRSYDELSEGERFRARLARALGAAVARGGGGPLLVDEFGSGLHRRAAKAIAYNLRKLATRRGLAVAIATSNADVLADLQPDTLIHLESGGTGQVERCSPLRKPISLWRRLRIEPGTKRDYDTFAAMHYRSTDELGFVDKVFVLREGRRGSLVAIVVYSHAPRELALRNQATDGCFKGNLKRVNAKLRILRRLIVHPDLRGAGVGHRFVRRTLPMVGTPFVECLATMGAVNPVFERAGMDRIGQCAPPRERQTVLDALREMEVDPYASDFETLVCRRPRLRRLVFEQVDRWYRTTTAGGYRRAERQSPRLLARLFRGLLGHQPVYYLWRRSGG